MLILKVVGSVLLTYPDYFPPNFDADFLQGREATFFGSYQWAFNAHILAGPLSLLLGLLLISSKYRARFPRWHRRLGRMQGGLVILLVSPSGLWMAFYAGAGPIAGAGFATLAILTALSMAIGWRAAVRRQYAEHEKWMWRCYLLLCSAVVIRLIGGLATVTGLQYAWIDPVAAWACWILPLAVYEIWPLSNRAFRRPEVFSRIVAN